MKIVSNYQQIPPAYKCPSDVAVDELIAKALGVLRLPPESVINIQVERHATDCTDWGVRVFCRKPDRPAPHVRKPIIK